MKTLPALILATAALALAAATNIQGAVTPANVPTVSNWLALTITNPTPVAGDYFGYSVAAVGNGRLLIGKPREQPGGPNAGAAYLFSTNSTLLATLTNPTLADSGSFGYSVAAVGTDRVLIGAPHDYMGNPWAGAAYLLGTNGALFTTFPNPTPGISDQFGLSLAAVGTDRVLIGAPEDDSGAYNAGAAYLFSTNGTLLTTFTNPTPADFEYFGQSVAAVGSDRVLIGAIYDSAGALNAGAVYLFSTNGTLLTTFTNPTPADSDYFGASVAAVGTDGVLIGAREDDSGAYNAGAAYLFSTNGTLLTTFTNPIPAASHYFGWSIATVGIDRVLIGAIYDDLGVPYAGAAYLFSTNGVLLTTFANPTPAAYDSFGYSVAAVGADRVLISGAGEAYLFSLEPFTPAAPSLSTSRNPSLSTLTISWPAPAEGWMLEGTNALPSVPASAWPPVPPPYQTNAGTISVTLTNQPATGNQFFRLRQP